MHFVDWLIVILPMLGILGIAIYSKKYIKGVVDYLAAGRVAGRYVLTVGDMTAGLGILSLVAISETYYRSGGAYGFWGNFAAPVGLLFTLSGFCIYRFRESKALSNGQFLEMRYSRRFRVLASIFRIGAEMLTNAIGPAVAVNFFIYYLGLPHSIIICGVIVPTFAFLVAAVLILALVIILPAGRISLLITDSIQGLVCYPVFVAISVFILVKFSYFNEIFPVMANRVEGESFYNPFDIDKMRDFNLFSIIVMIIGSNYNRASWAGNDTTSAGRTPHEQKMASVLGVWRMGLGGLMCGLLALTVLTFMNHPSFANEASNVRKELSKKVMAETVTDAKLLAKVNAGIDEIPVITRVRGKDAPLSQEDNIDTVYMDKIHATLGDTPETNLMFQKFRSLYNQMMMPMGLKTLLPAGLFGAFCLLALLLMVTTDDSRIFNSSTAIIQDLVIPFKKEPMTPEKHTAYVKWCTVGVAVFFFCGSMLFSQMDFIQMFITIMCSVWLGGAAPIMVFGLYSKFGNTVGAYCALIFGSGSSIAGLVLQRNWADRIYPFLQEHGWVEAVGKFLETISGPFHPYVEWHMDPVKCPINGIEFYFIAMAVGTGAYVLGSLLTYRRPFNLERLLHRGKYNTDGVENINEPWTLRNMWSKIVGITPDYTRGDRIIAWTIVAYSLGWGFVCTFLGVLLWNMIQPWPESWWANWGFFNTFILAPAIGAITTVWFFCGGVRDIRRLFMDLKARVDNPLDNGMVEGHVALSDVEVLGKDES